MAPILFHTTKYDQSLHYRFDVESVAQTESTLVVYSGPGVEVESYRGTRKARRHMLAFFHADRYHNVLISWHENWSPHMHYVNIATPATWNASVVSAIDLDLDVIRPAASGEIIVDDEDEFETHTALFGYPRELIETCRSEVLRVREAMQRRLGVFSDAIFHWRPGEQIDQEYLRAL